MLGESNFAVIDGIIAGSASSNLSHADPNVPVRHRRVVPGLVQPGSQEPAKETPCT
jgi:hypothetical protein